MTKKEIYTYFANLIFQHTGIHYPEQNFYQLESRLHDLCRFAGVDTLEEIHQVFKKNPSNEYAGYLQDIATNNETSFFRDKRPFQSLVEIAKEWHKTKVFSHTNPLKIWSAACSKGQEPYSIIMSLLEGVPSLSINDFKIQATDFSQRVLDYAQAGVYTQMEVQKGLPIQLLLKFFDDQQGKWSVKDELKSPIQFRKMNLFSDHFGFEKYHIIFCRNVLIYQTQEHKQQIVENLTSCLEPGGYLYLGSSENLLGISDQYTPQRIAESMVYQKNDGGASASPELRVS